MGELESEAARHLGRVRSERKRQATRENLEVARQVRWTDERKRAHSKRMKAVWAEKNREGSAE